MPFSSIELKNADERIVVAHRDRIVLVIVAAGAFEREAQHGRAERVDAVGGVLDQPLLGDRAAFVRQAMQPIECRGENLIARWRSPAGRPPAAR